MIIPNGYIEVKQIIGGGINPQTDFPTPAQGVWSGRIACQFSAKSYRHATVVSGELYTKASYEILVDELDVEGLEPTMVRLWDDSGYIVGEYQIISIQHLKGARVYKITV